MKNKKLMLFSFILILGMLTFPLDSLAVDEGSNAFENIDYERGSEIRVILEGKPLDFDVAPQIIDGRVLVPMRKIFESFGLTVTWNATTKTARGHNSEMDILFPIGSTQVQINGLATVLDVPAQIISGSTMVPLRFLSEHMDYTIVWNSDAQLILLSRSTITEWRYGGYETEDPYKEFETKYVNGYITSEIRYTGVNHDVTIVNLYSEDGRIIQNVPDFRLINYTSSWSQKSSFVGKTYWIHMDELTKAIQTNPIYLQQDLLQLATSDIAASAEVGNYVKVTISEQYFDLNTWKKVIGREASYLYTTLDEATLDEKVIDSSDTFFKVEINDKYATVIPFNTLNVALFNRDSEEVYTILNESPSTLFDWDAATWTRIEEKIPWTGMTQDMLLVQFKIKPDQTTTLTTKFSKIDLWIYTEDYGDSIYYFKDDVLSNIL